MPPSPIPPLIVEDDILHNGTDYPTHVPLLGDVA